MTTERGWCNRGCCESVGSDKVGGLDDDLEALSGITFIASASAGQGTEHRSSRLKAGAGGDHICSGRCSLQ